MYDMSTQTNTVSTQAHKKSKQCQGQSDASTFPGETQYLAKGWKW